jgi:hypothetical protein
MESPPSFWTRVLVQSFYPTEAKIVEKNETSNFYFLFFIRAVSG